MCIASIASGLINRKFEIKFLTGGSFINKSKDFKISDVKIRYQNHKFTLKRNWAEVCDEFFFSSYDLQNNKKYPLSKSESIKFLLIESVICLFTDSPVNKIFFTNLQQNEFYFLGY